MLDFSNIIPPLRTTPVLVSIVSHRGLTGYTREEVAKKEYEFNLRRPREEKGGKVVVKASLCGRRSGSKNRM